MRRVLPIMFHQIGDPWKGGFGPASEYCMPLDDFLDAADRIARKVPILSWNEIGENSQWLSKPDDNLDGVLLTFDDGYREHYQLASGIMLHQGWPGIFFICTGFVTGDAVSIEHAVAQLLHDGKWNHTFNTQILSEAAQSDFDQLNHRNQFKRIMSAYHSASESARSSFYTEIAGQMGHQSPNYVSPVQVKALTDSDLHTVGLHTHSHPYLPTLAEQSTHADLDAALDKLLQLTGRKPALFAYPYGGSSEATEQWLQENQFQAAFVTERYGYTPKNPLYQIPRFDACSHSFKQWVSQL